MSITTPKAEASVQSDAGPAAQPDISAVMDMNSRSIVHVTVSGPTGSGKSAICAWIVRAMQTAGVPCDWVGGLDGILVDDDASRAEALRMYRPSVRLHEANISRVKKDYSAETLQGIAHALFWLAQEPRGIDVADLLCGAADRFEKVRREIYERDDQIVDLKSDVHNANMDAKECARERDVLKAELEAVNADRDALYETVTALQVQLKRFHSERAYVIGVNDGYEAAEKQFSTELGEQGTEIVELRERCSGLYDTVEAAIVKIRGFAGTDESDVEFLKRALGQPQDEVEDVALRTTSQVRDDAIRAAYAPGQMGSKERSNSLAIIHFDRLVTIRLVLEALEAKFGPKALGKTNVSEALLDTVEFMQGTEFVLPRAAREKRANDQRQDLSRKTIAGIREAILGMRS